MPLLINGTQYSSVPGDVSKFIVGIREYKIGAEKLKQLATKAVPVQGLLYIDQREFAATVPSDENVCILGSQDATTCHIAVVRHTGSGATALGHLDGQGTREGVKSIVRKVIQLNNSHGRPEGRIELHLIGGFLDERKLSKKVEDEILEAFDRSKAEIHLTTACMSELNDVVKEDGFHYPVIYGIAVAVKTGDIFPAEFPDRGPDIHIRSATSFVGKSEVLDIYEADQGHLHIDPVEWGDWPDVGKWLTKPDEELRQRLSTSPKQEPPSFAANTRATLEVIYKNPSPGETLFPDNKPHTYKMESGVWILIK